MTGRRISTAIVMAIRAALAAGLQALLRRIQMWRRKVVLLFGSLALLIATAAAAAGTGSGVRVAKHGVGAYIGPHMGKYIAVVLAKSPTLLEISMHPWTTCYPTYESVNGQRVKLSPSQQKQFAESSGWNVAFPNVQLSASGSFQKRETVRGPNGSHPTISGQVNGNKISGSFSATGIINGGPGGYHCDNVSFAWTATFDRTAQPDPTLFRNP